MKSKAVPLAHKSPGPQSAGVWDDVLQKQQYVLVCSLALLQGSVLWPRGRDRTLSWRGFWSDQVLPFHSLSGQVNNKTE